MCCCILNHPGLALLHSNYCAQEWYKSSSSTCVLSLLQSCTAPDSCGAQHRSFCKQHITCPGLQMQACCTCPSQLEESAAGGMQLKALLLRLCILPAHHTASHCAALGRRCTARPRQSTCMAQSLSSATASVFTAQFSACSTVTCKGTSV